MVFKHHLSEKYPVHMRNRLPNCKDFQGYRLRVWMNHHKTWCGKWLLRKC